MHCDAEIVFGTSAAKQIKLRDTIPARYSGQIVFLFLACSANHNCAPLATVKSLVFRTLIPPGAEHHTPAAARASLEELTRLSLRYTTSSIKYTYLVSWARASYKPLVCEGIVLAQSLLHARQHRWWYIFLRPASLIITLSSS